jgi:hypothetical protein
MRANKTRGTTLLYNGGFLGYYDTQLDWVYAGRGVKMSINELVVLVFEELKKNAIYYHEDEVWASDKWGISNSFGMDGEVSSRSTELKADLAQLHINLARPGITQLE